MLPGSKQSGSVILPLLSSSFTSRSVAAPELIHALTIRINSVRYARHVVIYADVQTPSPGLGTNHTLVVLPSPGDLGHYWNARPFKDILASDAGSLENKRGAHRPCGNDDELSRLDKTDVRGGRLIDPFIKHVFDARSDSVSRVTRSREIAGADFGGDFFFTREFAPAIWREGGVGEQEFRIMSVEQNGGMVLVPVLCEARNKTAC
jgi:hypothetical protein